MLEMCEMTEIIRKLEGENNQLRDALEDKADIASNALNRAWQLGITYWQQADSESYKKNKLSAVTERKFQQLVDETRAAILQ